MAASEVVCLGCKGVGEQHRPDCPVLRRRVAGISEEEVTELVEDVAEHRPRDAADELLFGPEPEPATPRRGPDRKGRK